jgi:G patch domain/KOW motif-containing protein
MSNEPMNTDGSMDGRKSTKFTLKSTDSKKKSFQIQQKEEQESKDYVKHISEHGIESETPKEQKKRIIIPVIETKRFIPKYDPLKLEVSEEEKFIVPEDHMVINTENDAEEKDLPLLLRHQNPELLEIEDEKERFKKDVESRPVEMSPEDEAYKLIPIQEYGTAVLLGMGWKPGTAIGKSGKGIIEPILLEPRHHRLGLGAKKPKPNQISKPKKFIKPGEYRDPKEAERQKKKREGFVAGKLVGIVDGQYDGEYARVLTVDSIENTINVQLQSTYEIVTLEPEQLIIVDVQKLSKDHPALSFLNNKKREEHEGSDNELSNGHKKNKHSHDRIEEHEHHSKHKRSKHKKKSSSSSSSSSEDEDSTPWLMPHIRVRFINKKYGKGKYYNLKGTVIDATKQKQCIFKLDSGELLEDVLENMLETVVPGAGGRVMIVGGPYRGTLGLILDKKTEKETADVLLLSGENESDIQTLHLDHIAEYVGPE